MFGYIRPLVCELKVREHETYKAYYCGLCHALKKRYPPLGGTVLSNDCTFFALLADALLAEEPRMSPLRCVLAAGQKRMWAQSPAFEYAAALNIMLSYAKADDDRRDDKRGFAAAMLRPAYRRAVRQYPAAGKAIEDMTRGLCLLEAQKSANVDAAAHAFACMLGRLLEPLDVERWDKLYDFGYNLGRWLYLIDAIDDWERDAKTGAYNVFRNRFGGDRAAAGECALFNLNISAARALDALHALRFYRNGGILRNVVEMGLNQSRMLVYAKRNKTGEKD